MSKPSNSRVKVDLSKLKGIEKALKSDRKVRIGILGSKASEIHKYSDGETNAEIGAKHEYGSMSDHIPKRSFLWEPLKALWGKVIMKEAKGTLEKALADNDIDGFFEKVGFKGEEIVNEAFETSGFGQWKPISAMTLANRKESTDPKPLLDTGQLARSIASEVIVDNKRKQS